MADEDFNATRSFQRQTILNLYNSAIPTEIISFQLDMSQEQVENIIGEGRKEQEKLSLKGSSSPDSASLGLFYLDAVVNIDLAIKRAQISMWEALRSETKFDISMEETNKILEEFAKSKVTLVILHVDLVDSTRLLMTLPVDRLSTIIQAFTREMSLIIEAYGGYILKYIGDAILAFFTVNIIDDLYLPCVNEVNCARSMIKIVRQV